MDIFGCERDRCEGPVSRTDLRHIVSGDVDRLVSAPILEENLYPPHPHAVLASRLDLFHQRFWEPNWRPTWQLSRSLKITGHVHRVAFMVGARQPADSVTRRTVTELATHASTHVGDLHDAGHLPRPLALRATAPVAIGSLRFAPDTLLGHGTTLGARGVSGASITATTSLPASRRSLTSPLRHRGLLDLRIQGLGMTRTPSPASQKLSATGSVSRYPAVL